MKVKTLVTLLVVLLLLAITGWLLFSSDGPQIADDKKPLGTPLLDDFPVNDVAQIAITSPEESVTLARNEDQWVVKEHFGYRADFAKIASLVRKFKDLEVGRQFPGTEETLKRLALREPGTDDVPEEEIGTKLVFSDAEDNSLVDILVGKARTSSGGGSYGSGHYVTVAGDDTVYLVDKSFSYLRTAPLDWIEKKLADIESEDIKRIVCGSADNSETHYILERAEKGEDLLPVGGVPEGKKVKKAEVNHVSKGLSPLDVDDVVDPSHDLKAIEEGCTTSLEYQLFNGMKYRVYPGAAFEEDKKYYLKLEVAYEEPVSEQEQETPEKEDASTEGEDADAEEVEEVKEAPPEDDPEKLASEAARLQGIFSEWVYVIPKWKKDAFKTDLSQLLE